MDIAIRTSQQSYAERLKVGAVATRGKRLLCVGFNGTPELADNCCEDENFVTLPSVIHAEHNLIRFANELQIDISGSVLYITHSPCVGCAEKIIVAGISEVVYREEYRCNDGIYKLKDNNIKVRKYGC